jgi:hypothetical protein
LESGMLLITLEILVVVVAPLLILGKGKEILLM